MEPLRNALDWAFGVHKPRRKPVRQKPYIWERPDLIDPPLRPLPSSRPRHLSDSQDEQDQLQSALVARLPAEIRAIILEHVVGREDERDALHLELADGILRYNRCYERDVKVPGFQHNCWTAPWRKRFRDAGLMGKNEPKGPRRTILPLLLTCRLIYRESIDLLYSTNTFDFRRTDALIRLPNVMLPHRLQQIRHIQFSTSFACYTHKGCHTKGELPPGLPADFWEPPDDRRQWAAACQVLASLQNLQSLRITIILACQLERHRHDDAYIKSFVRDQLWFGILEPLKAVHASDFTVETDKALAPLEIVLERLGIMPFRLVERETEI